MWIFHSACVGYEVSVRQRSAWYANVLFHFSGAVHTSRDELNVYRPKRMLLSSRKYPICNWVHSYSISPCQTPFFKSMRFATISKPWMATELTKTVCTQEPGAHFHARVQGLDLVLGHRHRVRILAWVCLKKGCVHISAQRVPYLGTVSGHQVWRLPYFFAYNRGNRTSLPARRLFVPLMSNSDFNKTEQFFVSA